MINVIVGMFERNQLTPQQVRRYLNEVNNKRKDLLQTYIQLSNEAKVIIGYHDIDIYILSLDHKKTVVQN